MRNPIIELTFRERIVVSKLELDRAVLPEELFQSLPAGQPLQPWSELASSYHWSEIPSTVAV